MISYYERYANVEITAFLKHSLHFFNRGSGVAHVFERHLINYPIDGAISKRQSGDVRDDIDFFEWEKVYIDRRT